MKHMDPCNYFRCGNLLWVGLIPMHDTGKLSPFCSPYKWPGADSWNSWNYRNITEPSMTAHSLEGLWSPHLSIYGGEEGTKGLLLTEGKCWEVIQVSKAGRQMLSFLLAHLLFCFCLVIYQEKQQSRATFSYAHLFRHWLDREGWGYLK